MVWIDWRKVFVGGGGVFVGGIGNGEEMEWLLIR